MVIVRKPLGNENDDDYLYRVPSYMSENPSMVYTTWTMQSPTPYGFKRETTAQ